jgi:cytochrome c553
MSRLRAVAAAVLATLGVGRAAAASPAQDYMLYCMGCHGPQAQGVPGKIPPLAGALARYMRTPEGRNYVLRVPGAANSALSDAQLAAVLNWLAETYAPAGDTPPAAFSTEEVTRSRHTPLADVQATRRAVVRALAASGPAPASDY